LLNSTLSFIASAISAPFIRSLAVIADEERINEDIIGQNVSYTQLKYSRDSEIVV
jgi:hypothetical protein